MHRQCLPGLGGRGASTHSGRGLSMTQLEFDLFASYSTRLYNDKIRATFQLNVKNVNESGGGLQATGAFFDGRPSTYRIIDPRQFILTASFDL